MESMLREIVSERLVKDNGLNLVERIDALESMVCNEISALEAENERLRSVIWEVPETIDQGTSFIRNKDGEKLVETRTRGLKKSDLLKKHGVEL